MVVRNVSKPRQRGFGAAAIFVAALALLAASAAPASAQAVLSSSKTIVALSLVRVDDGREAFEIRGTNEESEPNDYSAVATLSRIPCPGSYRYGVQSENQKTGAQSAYSAVVELAPAASDRPPPCGDLPPARPRGLRIMILGEGAPVAFPDSSWSGSGGFFGDLTLIEQPRCDARYTLAVSVDLRGRSRSVRYGLEVVRWKAEAQGMPLENHPSC